MSVCFDAIEFNNSDDWELVQIYTKEAEELFLNRFDPIAPFDLGITLNTGYVGVVIQSVNSQPTWRSAGEIRQTWTFDKGASFSSNFGTIQSRPYYIPLNKVTILTLNNEIPQASSLRYHAPKWFKDFTLYLWKYTGIPRNFTKDTLFEIGNRLATGTIENPDSIPALLNNQQAAINDVREQLLVLENYLVDTSSNAPTIQSQLNTLNQNVSQNVSQINQRIDNLNENLAQLLDENGFFEPLESEVNPATIDEEFI